jgi:hypothetical protein
MIQSQSSKNARPCLKNKLKAKSLGVGLSAGNTVSFHHSSVPTILREPRWVSQWVSCWAPGQTCVALRFFPGRQGRNLGAHLAGVHLPIQITSTHHPVGERVAVQTGTQGLVQQLYSGFLQHFRLDHCPNRERKAG